MQEGLSVFSEYGILNLILLPFLALTLCLPLDSAARIILQCFFLHVDTRPCKF